MNFMLWVVVAFVSAQVLAMMAMIIRARSMKNRERRTGLVVFKNKRGGKTATID